MLELVEARSRLTGEVTSAILNLSSSNQLLTDHYTSVFQSFYLGSWCAIESERNQKSGSASWTDFATAAVAVAIIPINAKLPKTAPLLRDFGLPVL